MSKPATSTEPTKSTTIHFPENLRAQLRSEAGKLEKSMNEFVIDAVKEKLGIPLSPQPQDQPSAGA